MSRVIEMRLRKLEKQRPSGLASLSNEELDARIDAVGSHLVAESIRSGGPATLVKIFADDPKALSLLRSQSA